jgi:CDP-glucose 4,6-dehydratase
VLDPLVAYLMLAQRLVERGREAAGGWNIGPSAASEVPVSTVADLAARFWGGDAAWAQDLDEHPHEAGQLRLNTDKARLELGWRPLIGLEEAVRLTVEWYRAAADGADPRALSLRQVEPLLAAACVTRAS